MTVYISYIFWACYEVIGVEKVVIEACNTNLSALSWNSMQISNPRVLV